MQKKIVITGGPGTGKTMVIDELIKRSFICKTEISRQVTIKAREDGVDQLFLTQPLLFSELLLEGRVKQFLDADKSEDKLIFFDRGIPDVHSYMDYLKTEYPPKYFDKSDSYRYSQVFLMPPWEEIYTSDNERYETYEQSLDIYFHIKKAYVELGYQITEVPHGSITERTEFILNSI